MGAVEYWTCPECGRRFARRGQRHVCGSWTVDDHLRGKDRRAVALFRRFVELVEACGPVELSPTKTTVTFQLRRGFASAKPTADGLAGYLDLMRRVDSPRFRNVSPYTKRLWVHHFTIRDEVELDDEFAGWVREAYEVGQGRHLEQPAP